MQKGRKKSRAIAPEIRASDLQPEKLEAERDALLQRLAHLGDGAKRQRGYETVRRLLNQKFRKATLVARLGILQAASFMIDVLERTIPFV
jgi:hypothetical protein